MIRTLNIWWDNRLAGELRQSKDGDLSFEYAQAWLDDASAAALSASLPKRAGVFTRSQCRPFFGGLLPEEAPREAAAQALGVSRQNDFALLDRLGGDVAGALQLLKPDEKPSTQQHSNAKPLSDRELIAVLDRLPLRPLLAGEEGMRLSLAGAQPKVPVVLVGNSIALPAPNQPTTHILKPPITRFTATTENEALVMRLAKEAGLDVASVDARVVQDRGFLLVQRYDRENTNGKITRIHQEDFCQALAIPPETKYASEGGPTFKDCFALIRRVSDKPALDVLKLLDAAIFNLIAGNADAHGKNFSWLYQDGTAKLAPLYDLLSTVMYKELSPKLAMRIGKRATLEDLDTRGWTSFATDAGLGLPLVRRRVNELSAKILSVVDAAAHSLMNAGLNEQAIAGHVDMIKERASHAPATIKTAT